MNRFILDDLTNYYSPIFSNSQYYYEIFLRFLCTNQKLNEICGLIFYEEEDYYEMFSKLPKTPEVINKFVDHEMIKYVQKRCLLDDYCYPVDDNIDIIKENLIIYLKKKNLKLTEREFDILLVSSFIDVYLEIAYSISFEMYSSDWWEVIDAFLSKEGRKDRNKLYSLLINGMNLRNYSKDMVFKILSDLYQKKKVIYDSEKF